nr:DUF6221 family protein [Streptomyces sp. N502]
MTVSEIAEEHGVSRQSVHSYRRRGTFPKPVEGEGSTRPRFRAHEVAAWFAANPPRPGKRTDLATRDEGASVETSGIAVPPGVALEATREFVQWLRAQLDEDERMAQTACEYASPEWRTNEGMTAVLLWPPEPNVAEMERRKGLPVVSDEWRGVDVDSAGNAGLTRHMAEHDPARVLREVDSKKQILGLFAAAVEDRVALRARMRKVVHTDPDEFGQMHQQESKLIEAAEYLAPVVRLLALPYADRPGYRESWRP